MKQAKNALFILMLQVGNSEAGWFSPNTYADCIKDSGIEDAKTETAARAIRSACIQKHPVTSNERGGVPLSQIRKNNPDLDKYGYSDCDTIKWLAESRGVKIETVIWITGEDLSICGLKKWE
jgi:hypothetical protein